ncbi:hypothetical protein MVEN_01847700 [Mycena venus]|uniref:F-box domain-containing protein n=1 Tax=Mycena venus TaxID=2733690 RepID=A0A8H6XGM2_9AGAR|nr:hypothetical protein MVEN_01847700 [Mycena venus]
MAPSLSFTIPEQPEPPAFLSHAPLSRMESSLAVSYIDELESQVTLVDEAIARLQIRREDLIQSIQNHKTLLSPIRRLPREILGEIFSLAVYSAFHSGGGFGFTFNFSPLITRKAPWLLTHVCQDWSAAVLANPALWSLIFVDLDDGDQRGIVRLTKLWLQRSGDVPLTIKVFGEDPRRSHPVLKALLLSRGRWQTAHFSVPTSQLSQIMASEERLSALTTSIITVEGRPLTEEFWDLLADDAPQLRTLQALSWEKRHLLRASFPLPWNQLTRLSTSFNSNTEALAMLQNLSDIVECTFAWPKSEILSNHSTIPLLHLRSLVLQVEGPNGYPDEMYQKHTSLLDFLETPSLRRLTTRGSADEEAVLGLITRSDCTSSLTRLYFHSSAVNQSEFVQLIQKLPRLASLHIEDLDGALFPKSGVPTFIGTLYDQWLKSRDVLPGASLPSCSVRIMDSQYSGDISRELAKMHEHGFFVEILPDSFIMDIIEDRFNY